MPTKRINNPYTSPPEVSFEKRPVNLPRLILAVSLTAALMLVFWDAPRWLIVLAGASAALAAEEMISNRYNSASHDRS